jgi:hypothetical protein
VNQQFEILVYDFWNFLAGWRGLPALALHCGTTNNEAMAPISCLTWRQKSGSNHPGGFRMWGTGWTKPPVPNPGPQC